jgi:hypothetical protein
MKRSPAPHGEACARALQRCSLSAPALAAPARCLRAIVRTIIERKVSAELFHRFSFSARRRIALLMRDLFPHEGARLPGGSKDPAPFLELGALPSRPPAKSIAGILTPMRGDRPLMAGSGPISSPVLVSTTSRRRRASSCASISGCAGPSPSWLSNDFAFDRGARGCSLVCNS